MNHATTCNITTCDLWFSWWSTVRMYHLGHVLLTKLCTIMMYNPAPMGPDRCHIIKYSGLLDSTYTEWCHYRQFYVTALTEAAWHLPVTFTQSLKHLAFSTIIGPVMGFPSKCTAANHLYNTLSNCANSGSFKVCCLIRPFTLSLKATNDHNWSLHFSVSHTVMIWCFIKS